MADATAYFLRSRDANPAYHKIVYPYVASADKRTKAMADRDGRHRAAGTERNRKSEPNRTPKAKAKAHDHERRKGLNYYYTVRA